MAAVSDVVGFGRCSYVGSSETSFFMTLLGREDDLNEPEPTRYSVQTAHPQTC